MYAANLEELKDGAHTVMVTTANMEDMLADFTNDTDHLGPSPAYANKLSDLLSQVKQINAEVYRLVNYGIPVTERNA
jgi:hypothetical protein